MTGELPDRIGPYLVDGVLGRGGMGIVYRGTHADSKERVAIKTVAAETVDQQSGIRREVHTLTRLAHPGVVRIVDSGTTDAVPWYAMSLLEGSTLADFIGATHAPQSTLGPSNSTLDFVDELQTFDFGEGVSEVVRVTLEPEALQRSLRIATRLMSTLAHLHSLGVVHRDIKPANIFLVSGDAPVLVDFGLAHRGAVGASRETLTGQVLAAGTPAYMAPEVIRGSPADARADLYSAGCVLFEIFSGRTPFMGTSTGALVSQHLNREAPPLDDLVEGLPDALLELVSRLLEKEPRTRLSHAVDALELLAGLIDDDLDDYAVSQEAVPLYRPSLAGRSSDLKALVDDMCGPTLGRGGLTVVLGRSGIGKTYLVSEAVRRAAAQVAVVPGRCTPMGPLSGRSGGAPLHPLSEWFDLLADTCAGSSTLTSELLSNRGPILAPFNRRLDDLPGSEAWPEPASLEGLALRDRLIGAVQATMLSLAAHQPMVLLVDDLQWADGLTMATLRRLLAGGLTGSSLRVVATCRVEEVNPAIQTLLDLPEVRVVEVGSLEPDAVEQIIGDIMATRAPPEALVDRLVASADGSPFFVAEYLRTANALGLLRRGRLGHLEMQAGAEAELPDSLLELVKRRLATLPEHERQLVNLASVMGRTFDQAVVAQASGLPSEAVMGALYELERLQVMEPTSLGGLQLAHDKLAEAAYDALPSERRASLHGAIAQAIEATHGDDLSPHYGVLAHHHELAGHPNRALDYYRKESEAAFGQLAYERAVYTLLKVLDLGAERLAPRDRAHYAQMLGESYWSMGDMPLCEKYTKQAFADLGHRLPTSMVGWVLRIFKEAGIQALHLFGIGVGTVREPERREDLRRLAVASNTLCWRFLFDDNIPYILALAIGAANRVEQASPFIPLATAHGWLAFNAGALRLHGLAQRYFDRAHASAEASGDLPSAVFAILMESLYLAGYGRFEEMFEGSERALAMLEGQGDPQNEELHNTNLGNISYLVGDFDRCIRHFEVVHEKAVARSNLQHEAWGRYAQCWGFQARGEFERARPHLEYARDLLAQNADLPSEIIVFANLSLNALRRGDLEQAEANVVECAERIHRTKVANYPTAPAYGMGAEVAIELCRLKPEDRTLRKLARRLVRDSSRLTLLLPYGTCIAHRVKGLLQTLDGKAKAPITLRTAADEADALGMKFEAAQAWWALAVHHAEAVPESVGEARRRLEDLGCAWHLAQLPQA